MTSRPLGLFDQEIRQRKLQALGDPLVELDRIVPWGMFRKTLESMRSEGHDPRKGGRPPHDAVRMFKVLVLRELYALSDEQVEYQIADRLSFQRFLGIDLTQDAPDYTAIWRFRERLGAERMKTLFEELGAFIDVAGFEARKGQMLDASLVQKPKTRKPVAPKDGEPALTRQQVAHRDGEANWTQKHNRTYFGYKNHINADVEHGFIRDYAVTPAATHDSQALPELLDISQRHQPLYADSAYRSAATARRCKDYRLIHRVMHKAQRNRPLTAAQKRTNHRWAKTRARVEHVFARIDLFRKGRLLRCTGLARSTVVIGLINFAHNLRRLATMVRLQQQAHASG
jgi:IS5 family transposase